MQPFFDSATGIICAKLGGRRGEKMKFSEKLVILRKKNNLSQEGLADKLGVSRQAVSKWESASSVPDMEKMMQLCKILNCTLEELVDDGVGGSNKTKALDERINFKEYYQEFLDFITKTFNMFWSMRLVERVKCILEMLFIAFILYLVWLVCGVIIQRVFADLIYLFPHGVIQVIRSLSSFIYTICGVTVGFILIIHIFKIRYLDYFITIEDNNTQEKSIETPIEEEQKREENSRAFIEKHKNKIIIRDPKHTTYHFFDFLARIVVLFLKGFSLIISIPCMISFIFITFLSCSSLFFLKDTILYFGIFLITVGALFINYLILKFIYNFIFNEKNNYKRIFILFIISLLLIGSGASVSFITYTSFELVSSYSEKNLAMTKEEVPLADDIHMPFLKNEKVEYVVDNTKENIEIEIMHPKEYVVYLYSSDIDSNTYFLDYYTKDGISELYHMNELFKEKKRIDTGHYYQFKIKIIAKEEVISKLKNSIL